MQTTREQSFQQIKVRRVFEEICEQIRSQLSSGALKPGDKLPAERDLALQFNVGRPAVREAVRTLEISGIVSLQKGVKGGAFIRAGDPTMLTRSIRDLMLLGRVSIPNLAEARSLISGAVIRLACERGTEDDFEAIERNIDFIESIDEIGHRTSAGVVFFRLIAQATRNEVLVMLVDSLGDIIRYVTDQTGRVARPELVAVRRKILKAMRERDADAAARWMDQYMTVVHQGMQGMPVVPIDASVSTTAVKRLAARSATVKAKPQPKPSAKSKPASRVRVARRTG